MMHAYVLTETRAGAAPEVCQLVAEIPGVTSTEIVVGLFDVIAAVEAEDGEELERVILHRIRAVEGVIRTQTCRRTLAGIPAGAGIL
jgi:DNA-binding Lrp family transcriptional regulator